MQNNTTTWKCARCWKPTAEGVTSCGCAAADKAAREAREAAALSAQTFGIEIETVGIGVPRAAAALSAVFGWPVRREYGHYDKHFLGMADGREWCVMTDGSLSHAGAEVVSPICRQADVELVQQVVRALRAAGAKADQSCGIHIHLGVEGLGGGRGIANLVKMVAEHEQGIRAMLNVLPSRQGYCKELSQHRSGSGYGLERPTFIQAAARLGSTPALDRLAAAWYGDADAARAARTDHYHHSRYHGLNLHSVWYRGTVELRWFNGSLHAGVVRAYLAMALSMGVKAAGSKSLRAKRTGRPLETGRERAERFVGWLGLDATCRAHLLRTFAPRPARQQEVA